MPLTKSAEEIMNKAEKLGIEYEKVYKGCAQTTFYAIVDALRWGGLELIPQKLQDELYNGLCLLSAGCCFTGEGTCGAVVGSVMASGFAYGLETDLKDPVAGNKAGAQVRDSLLNHFKTEYGSILCKDVMRKYFGKAWDLTSEKMTEEFLSITDGCVIRKTARYIVGVLIGKYEKGELKVTD